MIYRLSDDYYGFPEPEEAEPSGLLAVGGDLSPQRLLVAYVSGIFPWYSKGEPIRWWSLDPRMVLFPAEFRYSDSLRRTVRSGRFEVRVDTCFEQVMRACGSTLRPGQNGSWITEEMVQAYLKLHGFGLAHSFETFRDGQLVGGLYGVSLGVLFFGESMFHTERDASKVAFVRLVEFCTMHGFRLIDAQQKTAHLASLGARPIPRTDFLNILHDKPNWGTLKSQWRNNSVVLLLGSNMGDRERLLRQAVQMLGERLGELSRHSQIYETEPWGFQSEQQFLNCAVVLETDLSPRQVLFHALEVEQALGRVRFEEPGDENSGERQYSSRPIDIDLIFFNSAVVDEPDLQIPHPRMQLRRFVLEPLLELMPDFRHPVLRKTISELYSMCPDKGKCVAVSDRPQ